MKAKKHLVVLSSMLLLALSSCAHITVPDTQACAVNGILSAGASCDNTLSDKPVDLSLDEFITFLEPDTASGRGPAICAPSEDWNKIKTALEQACYILKRRCSYEMRQAIRHFSKTIVKLSGGKNELQTQN